MNYPNSDYYDINEKNKISFLRKNYLQSLQNFNRQFKVHSRNCLTNIQKKSKQYEFSDYEQMAEPKKPSPVLYQYSGYGKKVHHILDSSYNNITDKIKCFKQGDNNEDIFDVREYQRLLKKREEELYNNYKKNLSDNAKEGVSFYSIKRRYTPIIRRDNSSSILLAKLAKRNELCINPCNIF